MSLLTQRGVLFAFNCYVAAMLALGIAFLFNLSNPWWAALTVYLTSQPLGAASGAVWGRAWYRLLGTVAGVAAALVIIPSLIAVPEVMMVAIAVFIALCIYASLLDKTPRSYAFMLAGYTIALIGLPLVGDPSSLFETAVLRTEEISIGVVCAAVVHTLVFPKSVNALFQAKLNATLADAKRWILGALEDASGSGEQANAVRRKMAADLSELDALSRNLKFEAGLGAASERLLWALEAKLVLLLPSLTAVEDRLDALQQAGPVSSAIEDLVVTARQWVAATDPTGDAEAEDRSGQLLAACRSAVPELPASASWSDLLRANLCTRLADLVEAWRDVLHLGSAVRHSDRPVDARVQVLLEGRAVRRLHVDHGLAAYSGLAAGVAVLATAAFAMATGWAQGAAAVGITAAGCSVFAFADDPSPFLKLIIKLSAIAVPVVAIHLFAIFPLLDGFPMLALAMFPLLMVTGLLLASPKYWLHGLGLALTSQTLLAVQPSVQGDFVSFLNLAVAVVIGAGSALLVTLLMRVIRADVSAHRILHAGWRELGHLAVGVNVGDFQAWVSRMLDRQGLLIPRLARSAAEERLKFTDALNDLRVGINVLSLRVANDALSIEAKSTLDSMLGRLAQYFYDLARYGHRSAPPDLLIDVDESMRALLRETPSAARTRALIANAGVRRNLFPLALPFAPDRARA